MRVKAHITVFGIAAGQEGEVDGRRRAVTSALAAGWLTKVDDEPAPPPVPTQLPAPPPNDDEVDDADDGGDDDPEG